MTAIDGAHAVGRIVAEHPASAAVFRARGIDFCCQGELTLEQACSRRGLPFDEVRAELQASASRQASADQRLDDLSTPALIQRIVRRHHAYLRRALPAIRPLLAKVVAVHGGHNPRLKPLEAVFDRLQSAIGPHLIEEEDTLFPLLLAPSRTNSAVREALDHMVEEHRSVGGLLGELREGSDGYSIPEWGCASYQLLMGELAELEADLLEHIHLENHVLAPRFVAAGAGVTST